MPVSLLDVCFLLFNFKSFLYNLDTSALSDIYFGNIFSQILTSLFLTVFCTVEVLNFDIYSSYQLFSFTVMFLAYLKCHHPTLGHIDFPNIILLMNL